MDWLVFHQKNKNFGSIILQPQLRWIRISWKKDICKWFRILKYQKRFLVWATLYFSSQNARVMKKVPKDRLLIWNLKDGWEPICKFLNVPIPDQPIPVLNKTTDPLFFDRLRVDLRKGLVKNFGVRKLCHQHSDPPISIPKNYWNIFQVSHGTSGASLFFPLWQQWS